MRNLHSVAFLSLCFALAPLSAQRRPNDKASAYLDSLSPAEAQHYKELADDTKHFDPNDPRIIANVQGILGVLGYGRLSSGEMNAKTRSELKAFQKHAKLPQTGTIDLLTYFALSRELDHPPTYVQLRASNSFPAWATTVCFEEKSTDESMKLIENPENYSDDTAADFMVYGPHGGLGIQTEEFVNGRPLATAKWERQRNSNGDSNFTSVVLGKRHHDSTFMQLRLSWEPRAYFHIRLSSTSTGQPKYEAEGRCHPIKLRTR